MGFHLGCRSGSSPGTALYRTIERAKVPNVGSAAKPPHDMNAMDRSSLRRGHPWRLRLDIRAVIRRREGEYPTAVAWAADNLRMKTGLKTKRLRMVLAVGWVIWGGAWAGAQATQPAASPAAASPAATEDPAIASAARWQATVQSFAAALASGDRAEIQKRLSDSAVLRPLR